MVKRVNFLQCLIIAIATGVGFDALAVQAPNPRASSTSTQSARDSSTSTVSRGTVARTTARSVNAPVSARGAVVSNAARGGAHVARSAVSGMNIRGANARNTTNARSATTPNISRAGVARATTVFSDVSKIGGGYAACREAYATCMDQFCANANDTYRRCFCSSRFVDFRNTENALDEAKTLLMRFEDNNLNAVDKTAAEVNAMYSATVGEAAIKNDTSAAAKILDEIGDLLSGKKKTYTGNSVSGSLGILSFDLNSDVDDIWSDGGNSIFSGSFQNLAELEGTELYNAANNQCLKMIADSCENTPVTNMARSSYSIMITQDCNAYQKNIDKKVEAVKQTVRTAEKYLREARLEEYRSHNSADVNECISKVRTALTADTACGMNYKRCLDYTGAYVNQTTGEAIYSPRLFKLTELINLDGVNSDVLKQNPEFDKFLETRKMFATTALDSCRDISKIVWEEFKRSALIEIAQAQDEKIEEIKMSCVGTMADCYDTQSSALKDFDTTTAQMVGAVSAYAAKQMCMDKVSACAALFSNGESCNFDKKSGRLLNETACGLAALTNFVDSVDTIRISEGCETALNNYVKDLCADTTSGKGYPWGCRTRSIKEITDNITEMAKTYCNTDLVKYNSGTVQVIITDIINDIKDGMVDQMAKQCETLTGTWIDSGAFNAEKYSDLKAYYSATYGNNQSYIANSRLWGRCIEPTVRIYCEAYNTDADEPLATYNNTTETCKLSTEWYKMKCTDELGGIWENSTCYISK